MQTSSRPPQRCCGNVVKNMAEGTYRLEGPVESMGYKCGSFCSESEEYWVNLLDGPQILMPDEMWLLVRKHFDSGSPGPWVEVLVRLVGGRVLAHMIVIKKGFLG